MSNQLDIAVVAIHAVNEDHMNEVMAEMEKLGPPTIRVCMLDEETARALERVHRLEAAKRLGLIPRIVPVGRDALVADLGLDWQDAADDSTVGDMLDYFTSTGMVYWMPGTAVVDNSTGE
jgi:hypothetical protein